MRKRTINRLSRAAMEAIRISRGDASDRLGCSSHREGRHRRAPLSEFPDSIPVCTENSNPDIVVMESAQDLRRDAPGPLNRARDRRILIQ